MWGLLCKLCHCKVFMKIMCVFNFSNISWVDHTLHVDNKQNWSRYSLCQHAVCCYKTKNSIIYCPFFFTSWQKFTIVWWVCVINEGHENWPSRIALSFMNISINEFPSINLYLLIETHYWKELKKPDYFQPL